MKKEKFWFGAAYYLLTPITRCRYGYKGIKYDVKPPFLLVCNHTSNWDPLYILASIPQPMHYLATDTITNIPLFGKLIADAFEPIPVDKADVDIQAIRKMKEYAKKGESIAIFPEGNRSFDGSMIGIKPATAKMIKLLQLPVIIFNLRGTYFKTPRWSSNTRSGKTYGYIRRILSSEEVRKVSVSELYATLLSELNVDAYGDQSIYHAPYNSLRRAEHIESLLYICPECNSLNSIRSRGCRIKCICCHKVTTMDKYGYLRNCSYDTVGEWNKYQIDFETKRDYGSFDNDKAIYVDDKYAIKIKRPDEGRIYKRGAGRLSLYKDRFEFVSYDRKCHKTYLFEDIKSVTPQGRSNLHMTLSDGTSIKLRTIFNYVNGIKYYYAYCALSGEHNTLLPYTSDKD